MSALGARPISYCNPVCSRYLADPFVWQHGGVYYVHGTGPVKDGRGCGLPLARSEDLVHWESLGGALECAGVQGLRTIWAGSVACCGGTFYLYYSAGVGDKGHQLRVAVSAGPAGPFVDTGEPLTGLADCPFAIDPQAFADEDGNWYLFYCADFLATDRGFRAGTALVARRLDGMTRLAGEQITILRARFDWQRFQSDRSIYGGIYDWHTLEGAFIHRHEGRYYCFYSGGRWENETYCVDYAVADSFLGPYSDAGGENGPRVLRTVPGKVIGPGNMSIAKGPDGRDYAVYHAWDPRMTARTMRIDPLVWTPDSPHCDGPTWQPQP